MTQSKHTPGPWRWLSPRTLVGDYDRRPVVLTSSDGGLECRGDDGLLEYLDPDSPDAHLIAAAPELLAALEPLAAEDCESYCGTTDPDHECALAIARAAIKKARGE